jgi:hypothetical protein
MAASARWPLASSLAASPSYPYQRKEALKRRDTGAETLAEIAKSYGVNLSMISRL